MKQAENLADRWTKLETITKQIKLFGLAKVSEEKINYIKSISRRPVKCWSLLYDCVRKDTITALTK